MKLKIIAGACVLAASSIAVADSYQAEVGAGVGHQSLDNDSEHEYYGVTGQYYFNPVQTLHLPLAEAAYLHKNGSVFAFLNHFPENKPFVEGNEYVVGVKLYIPESFLYVAGGVSRDEFDGFTADNDWFTTVGITPIDGLLVTTSYSHDQDYDANVSVKYVTDIGSGHFINIEAKFIDFGDDYTYEEIGGDYYFDNTFSVGGAFADARFGNQYTVRTSKFFTETFSGEVSYTDFEYGNQITASINFRF